MPLWSICCFWIGVFGIPLLAPSWVFGLEVDVEHPLLCELPSHVGQTDYPPPSEDRYDPDEDADDLNSYPYFKIYSGLGLLNGDLAVSQFYARVGYQHESGRLLTTVEIGPEAAAVHEGGLGVVSASLFTYLQISEDLQLYGGWDSVFSCSAREEGCSNQLTLGGLLNLRDGGIQIDPLSGITVLSSGFYLRLEAVSFWRAASSVADYRFNGYLGWSKPLGSWSLNAELGPSILSLDSVQPYWRPSVKLDVSYSVNSKTELVLSADHLFWPNNKTVSAFGSSLAVVRRF